MKQERAQWADLETETQPTAEPPAEHTTTTLTNTTKQQNATSDLESYTSKAYNSVLPRTHM